MPHLTERLLPGAPRTTLAVVGVLGAALVVMTAAGAPPGAGAPVLAATQLGLLIILRWRARHATSERDVWSRLLASAVVVTAATGTGAALGALGLPLPTDLVTGLGAVVGFPILYGAVVRWNRYAVALADPNDRINGFSAVLAVQAILGAVAGRSDGAWAQASWWSLQGHFAAVSTTVVLVGALVSVARISGLRRDVRVWLVVAAFAGMLPADLAALAPGGGDPLVRVAALAVGTVLLGAAAVLRPRPAVRVPADPTSSTVGAYVVMVASLVLLVVESASRGQATVTTCAALAAAGASLRLLVNVRELAALAASRREALTDELTGLPNRRAVMRQLEQWCEESVPVALALIDLDKFKEVNDGLGHAAGDDLLRQVAARLAPVLDQGEVLGRLGGDEFAVIGRADGATSPDGAAAWLGARVVSAMTAPFTVAGLDIHVTVSVGASSTQDADGAADAQDADPHARLLRHADAAMYDAKRSGRGLALYDAARHTDSSGHLALVEELRTGLRTRQVVLHHQPQVDVATGAVVGVEALVRWQHPVRGLLGPGDFLPLAEVHGLMGLLTDEVLVQAVTQVAVWHRAGQRLRMSVNLSATNLLDTTLPQRVATLLLTHGVPASALVLEVTEDVLMSDPERSRAVLRALADLGVALSIDDFGTGYSSLTYLRELPVSELKLDRSFTADLTRDPRAAAIVASTIGLAHALELRVVAEGVEDADTLERLRALGCDESQGYLHARPLPAVELSAWLTRLSTPAAAPQAEAR